MTFTGSISSREPVDSRQMKALGKSPDGRVQRDGVGQDGLPQDAKSLGARGGPKPPGGGPPGLKGFPGFGDMMQTVNSQATSLESLIGELPESMQGDYLSSLQSIVGGSGKDRLDSLSSLENSIDTAISATRKAKDEGTPPEESLAGLAGDSDSGGADTSAVGPRAPGVKSGGAKALPPNKAAGLANVPNTNKPAIGLQPAGNVAAPSGMASFASSAPPPAFLRQSFKA